MIEYAKDEDTGVVSLNADGELDLLAATRPIDGTVGEWVKARNHSGRVCIPGNGVPYQVAVITKTKTFIVGSGVTNAPTKATVTPIFVRARQEEPIAEPKAPVAEIAEIR